MTRRIVLLAAVAVSLFVAMPLSAASASPSPWWQVLTGSRPTHLWEATDNVQEIETKTEEIFGMQATAAGIEVKGELIGCIGSENFVGTFLCAAFFNGFPPDATAEQLEATLETAFGTSAVEVSGGPVGGEPFKIRVPKRLEPAIAIRHMRDVTSFPEVGSVESKLLSGGGSGRLILTLTNLGDAPMDASSSPLTITDELPEGVEATGYEAYAGAHGETGKTKCKIEAGNLVSCAYEGVLPSYEAIEIELFASVLGEPPVQGAPGKVTVEGANAPTATAGQDVQISPDEVPFGLERFSSVSEEEGGAGTTEAGRHPFQLTTTLQFNAGPMKPADKRRNSTVEQPAQPRNVRFVLPAGLVGNVRTTPRCSLQDFYDGSPKNLCADATTLGVASVTIIEHQNVGFARLAVPVFNLPPAGGEPARFGFTVSGVPVLINTAIETDHGYRVVASVNNASQLAELLSSTVTLWGTPGDSRHDSSRGWNCVYHFEELPACNPPEVPAEAFLRQPVACSTPLDFHAELEPWNTPLGTVIARGEVTGNPMDGCDQLPFTPEIAASSTNAHASGPSGLNFKLDMPNEGLLDGAGTAETQAKKVEVTLPEGVTVNPSEANGLGACAPDEYARETVSSGPGAGCPESSKIGTVDIKTPLLEEEAHGSVYVASPYENPFGSLLALYMVARIPERGVLIKQAGKVELNPQTGQLVTTFDDLPQVPFSTFDLHFKEGARAPLVMPEQCGEYDIVAKFTPWSAVDPNNPQPNEVVTRTTPLTVNQGPNGGACPSGTPPFTPGFTAGTENNAAGSYSPFVARLTRNDGEQEFSRFSLKLPKGVIGNLSGIPFCSEAAIAQARSRTGVNGGQEELENPSCPAASQIGRTSVGAGVGSALTYVPGKLYLAGPYQGAKLSVVAITPAKVGPFDLGNVVIRQALKVDPVTAEVSTDGSSSDPIPHILQGIVVHARDIRINVDRKDFVLNPTSCERMTASASVSGLSAVNVSAPFQAADCASLGFKPKLQLSLRGGTKRGANPRLKAVLTARKGDANIGAAAVKLPHSEFLEQGHIRTVCTRVQFNAGGGNGEQCPKGSVYGRVTAVTPLLDEPLSGPVYLRSSNHALPDLVAALSSGKVNIDLDGRIDSVHGGIRNTFEEVPDAPVTKFTLEMQGGKKGLLVNSTDICRGKHRATAVFTGQNGKRYEANPLVKAKCGGKKKHKKH